MTAREMFEELGYKYEDCRDTCVKAIEYEKEGIVGGDTDYQTIAFYFDNCTVKCNDTYESLHIDMPTFKAIQKQLEELGWL